MPLRFVLFVVVATASQLLLSHEFLRSAERRPNVLFLFTDDQRPDTIAALGNPVIKTPNLDQLAKTGFTFSNAYCMGSTMPAVCNPSRHMVQSGMSLYRYEPIKVEGTFGHAMRQAGYVTYHLSKRGNEAREYHKAFEFSGYLNDQEDRTSGQHGQSAANQAIEFLKNTWDREKPLFMYLGFEGPHDPRVAAKEWMDRYDRESIPLPANYKPLHPTDNDELLVRDERLAPWPRTEEEVRRHLHDYYACISSIDHQIGRILQTLRELKEFENTIIIFSSDHGLAIGSHGLFGKQNLYEHSMRSPLIFTGPGIPHGRSEALAYLFDIFPTACELAGVAAPDGLDGKSLAPVIRGEQAAVRETVMLAYMKGQRAVRRGEWKLIRYPQVNYTQLFNLRDDPHELKNLADDPTHAEKLAAMLDLLAREQKRYGDTLPLTAAEPKPAAVDLSYFQNAPPPQPAKQPQKRPGRKK
jgi:arylsulfatase A-like enzyme